ncbi:MAG: pirin family protein [Flavobacteriales bacterium]|nr:pirin family protein [Flavobacteriales bacterium]MCB9166559.1 pirin family protein [Flavobacteriales bacterium]MCB9170700.1 pirin family protein [Flavobacteriales bacterium]
MTKRSVEAVLAPPRTHMVGDGFKVSNFFPMGYNIPQDRLSPFFLLDYNAPVEFSPTDKPRGVGVHPHRGFETVTFAFQGKVAHHDSTGNSGIIGEGDVQWMTAASGVLHKEYHEAEFARKGGTFHMAQLWVNLPAKHKMETPRYQAIKSADMPEVQLPDGRSRARILAGELFGAKGPAKTWSPIIAATIELGADGKAGFELPAGFNSTILVVDGDAAVINGSEAPVHHLVILANDGTAVEVTSANGATLLVLSGEPLNEPIAAYGPFVMNTMEEIHQAMADVQAGKFGVLAD